MRAELPAEKSSDSGILSYIVAEARRSLALRRVLLFGSRARGDARTDSDLDIAFDHDSDDAAWADFTSRMRETAPTLLDLDLIDLRRALPALRAKVLAEGKVLYG